MDKRKGIQNVAVSLFFKILLTGAAIFERRLLIEYAGNDVNGLNSLFTSIIGFLSVAELGIGGAITFCMYKPIVEGELNTVTALYQLFKKLYFCVGILIAVAGLALTPFLNVFAKGYETINENIYVTFILMLISVVLTYTYSAKTSLLNAHKCEYITTTINSTGMIVQYILQIFVLIKTRSFTNYLICRIVAVLFQWIITEIVAKKRYDGICEAKPCPLDQETKHEVTRSIKAAFMHKIGTVLVNSADGIIISTLIGVAILGKYSNYTVIVTAMFGIITLFFTPLTSVIGHCCVSEDKEKIVKYFEVFYSFNLCIGLIFFMGYYSIIDDLVVLCFGEGLVLERTVPFIVSVNYFVQFMRKSTILFRDATGTFYYDRYKPIFEGALNIVLSIVLAHTMGIVGVIVATIITNLLICHVVEPLVLYKHKFFKSPIKHYVKRYASLLSFPFIILLQDAIMISTKNHLINLIVNGVRSVLFSLILCAILLIQNKDMRGLVISQFRGPNKTRQIANDEVKY